MSRRQRVATVLVVAAIAAIAAVGLLLMQHGTDTPEYQTVGDTREDPDQSPATKGRLDRQGIASVDGDTRKRELVPQASPAVRHELPAMPALDAPAAESIDALVERAEAGDPEATCRVLLEFGSCWAGAAAKSRAGKYKYMASEAASGVERANNVRLAAAYYDQAEINRGRCEGFHDYGRIRTELSGRIAAGLANLTAHQKVLLAMTDANGNLVRLPRASTIETSNEESLPVLVVYPQYLTDMDLSALDEGVAAADPLALEGKIILHMPTPAARWLGLRESLPDAYQFAKYAMMMRQLYGDESVQGLTSSVFINLGGAIPDDRQEALQQEVAAAVQQWRSTATLAPRKQLSRSMRESRALCSDTGG